MLNPGSSEPKNSDDWRDTLVLCGKDDTMRKIEDILKKVINTDEKGYIKIVNLSDKREPKRKEFFKNPEFKEPDKIMEEINGSPWFWLAWGADVHTQMEQLQRNIIDCLNSNKMKWDGIPGTKRGFYHPRYIVMSKQKDRIIEKLKTLRMN